MFVPIIYMPLKNYKNIQYLFHGNKGLDNLISYNYIRIFKKNLIKIKIKLFKDKKSGCFKMIAPGEKVISRHLKKKQTQYKRISNLNFIFYFI